MIVDQLSPVSYQYDLDKYPNMGLSETQELGFIAQEVQQVLPDITRTKTFSTNACTALGPSGQQENQSEEFVVMDYTRLVPVLTQAIKEQQEQIKQMQQTIEMLQQQIKSED